MCWSVAGGKQQVNLAIFTISQVSAVSYLVQYVEVDYCRIWDNFPLSLCWSSEGSHLESKFCGLALSSECEFNTQFYTVHPSFVLACIWGSLPVQLNSPVSRHCHWTHWKDRADFSRTESPIQGPTCGSCCLSAIDENLFIIFCV